MSPAGGRGRRTGRAYPHVPTFEDVPGIGRTSLFDANVLGLATEELSAANFGVRGLLVYVPTKSTNEARPRTKASYYDPDTQALVIRFRDGAYYRYDEVTMAEWLAYQRTSSPGQYINSVLNRKPYGPVESL